MQMLTKQIEAYKFNELNEDAKNNFRYKLNIDFWDSVSGDDYTRTLNAFCKKMDISWSEFDICPAFINFENHIKNNELENQNKDIFYKLLSLKNSEDCPFTGFYSDEDILKPIRQLNFTKEFTENFFTDFDYEQLIQDCMDNWLNALVKCYEYEQSDEYIDEMCEANNYLFTKKGEII